MTALFLFAKVQVILQFPPPYSLNYVNIINLNGGKYLGKSKLTIMTTT